MEPEDQNHTHPIPEIFHNYSTGTQFDRCIDCDRQLLDGETEYFIEKALKSYSGFSAKDVIFEYAICLPCAERLRKQMSKESMQSIQRYFSENINVMQRMQQMHANPENPEAWMKQCMVKGVSIQDLEEYQLYAHCKGNELVTSQMPYMISGLALDEISNLLSNETLDELDNFMDQHFGPPPELMEPLPTRRRPILV